MTAKLTGRHAADALVANASGLGESGWPRPIHKKFSSSPDFQPGFGDS